MADWYVDTAGNGASDSNTGHGWGASAFLTIVHAAASMAAGDRLFINHIVNDTYATSQSITWPGTTSAPNQIYSTGTSHTPPTNADLVAGATLTVTTSGSLSMTGSLYCWGVTFTCDSDMSVATGNSNQMWDTCTFSCTSTNHGFTFANSSSNFSFMVNCTISGFWRTANGNVLNWKGGTAGPPLTGTTNAPLFAGASFYDTFVEGVDMSSWPITQDIFDPTQINHSFGRLKDMKMASGAVITTQPAGTGSISTARADSSASTNQFFMQSFWGAENNELSITRVGGAQDFSGTSFSKKIVTNASTLIPFPFESMALSFVNLTVGAAHTVSVYGTWSNAGGPPNNNDIWIEVEYLGSSGNPLGSYVTSATGGARVPASVYSGSQYAADGSTWNNPPANNAPFVMTSAPFTPRIAGPITVRVYAAKASSTFYVDPKPVLN